MEYKLIAVRDRSDVESLNLLYLEKGWEVVSSVPQYTCGNGGHGLVIFTLRRPL